MKALITKKDLWNLGCSEYLSKELVKDLPFEKQGRLRVYKREQIINNAKYKLTCRIKKATAEILNKVVEALSLEVEKIYQDNLPPSDKISQIISRVGDIIENFQDEKLDYFSQIDKLIERVELAKKI